MKHLSIGRLLRLLGLLLVFAALPGVARAGAGISPGQWTSIGPANLGGRISAMAIHPAQTNKMWVGSPGGGIWKSTDSGASWSPVNDFLPSLVITSIVLNPGNPDVMYAGTGESLPCGHFRDCRDPMKGVGILKSVDGGATWTALPSTNPGSITAWSYIHKLAVHPTNGNVLLATNAGGLWRSADAGATWVHVLAQSTREVQFDPLDGNKALASREQVWHSTDAGLTWTESWGFPVDQLSSAIAYSRQAGVVYAAFDTTASMIDPSSVMRSIDGGITWSRVDSAPFNSRSGSVIYSNAIWVDPVDSNHVVVGWESLYRTTNAGATWTPISSSAQAGSVPEGQQVLVSSPAYNGNSNRTLYVGTYAGVYRAADLQAVTATNVGWAGLNNGLTIAQFYSGAGHAGVNGRTIGGTQGSGNVVYSGAGATWTSFVGNEGGDTAIDPTDGNFIYGGAPWTHVHRSMTGGAPSTDISAGIATDIHSNFAAPILVDPNNANVMLVGAYSLWRSTNVRSGTPSWSNIGGPRIEAIAVVPGNSSVIWLGTDTTGHTTSPVQKTTTGTAVTPNWNRMGVGILPAGRVRAILIDKDNANRVYVSIGDEVWRTTDGGPSWAQITGRLRAKIVRTLERHPTIPHYLYAGTDSGIWVSENGGDTWLAPNEAPANVRVDELFWIGTTLHAATHGRGMFRAAVSTPATYLLSVSKSGTGSGTVTSSPASIHCGVTCSAPFTPGTMVTLTATPAAGSAFIGWSGACSGSASTCVVTMNASASVAANFNLGANQTLTVFKSGAGSGPVSSSPSGIACGSGCSGSFPFGSSVTLTATPNSGSVFAGWSGACSGTVSTCLVTMTSAKEVTATFNKVGQTLTVSKAGTGSGPVTSSPAGIVCGSACSASFASGANVTLTATPNNGSLFAGWSGACTGTSTCVVTMNAAKSVIATFNTATLYALTVSKAGTGSGPVTSSPAGIACGSTCSKSFASGSNVTLTATANSGSLFAGWLGACGGSSSTCVVNMAGARNVTATFVPAIPLGQALDNTALAWATSGNVPWFGQTATSYDSVDAAQSGNLAANQVSVLSTTVQGPGTLSFRWRVASQPGSDFLTFYIGGVTNGAISGDSGWQLQNWSIPAGVHTLEWRYAKDGSISSNGDRAWVDQVQFTPASGAAR